MIAAVLANGESDKKGAVGKLLPACGISGDLWDITTIYCPGGIFRTNTIIRQSFLMVLLVPYGIRSHQLPVESSKINHWLVSERLFFYYTDGKEDKNMNQETIGKFVATCRKEKGLTQKQLAEKLNITDRAVSKWETGKSIPDAAIMLDLCKILGISANELLSGERIAMENYQKRAEENLVELQQKANNAQKSSNLLVKLVVLILGVLFIVKYGIGSRTGYFVDSISMEFILIPCLLTLLCTGYWRGFLKAFGSQICFLMRGYIGSAASFALLPGYQCGTDAVVF